MPPPLFIAFSHSLALSRTTLFSRSLSNMSTVSAASSRKVVKQKQSKKGRIRLDTRASTWFTTKGNPAFADPLSGPELLATVPKSLPDDVIAVVWLRNDLRVKDHAALAFASTADMVAPVFVFDLTTFGPRNKSPWGFQRHGPFRTAFLVESVKELTFSLRKLGTDMYIRQGKPVDEVLSIVRDIAEATKQRVVVVGHKETTWEEVRDERAVEEGMRKMSEEMNIPMDVHWLWTSTMHFPADLPFNPAGPAVPPTFTAYRKLVERDDGIPVREEIEMPERLPRFPFTLKLRNDPMPSLSIDLGVDGLADPHDYAFPSPLAVHDFKGGTSEAEDRVEEYIWRWKGLEEYKETRNLSGRQDSSTKLSPWLALGCLSPRSIYWTVKKFEEKYGATESTYHLIFELMTRDYFRWISASVGRKLFALNGFSGNDADSHMKWNLNLGEVTDVHRERLQKWIDGMTGAPFVDACMRELKATGFMSNRGRQNVASFLINDLEFPDWRAGAEYFESQLVDHDVASNWGNWAYLAGVGTDPRGGRKFNVIKQSMDYESDGWFLTKWCPELLHVPPPMIHEPHVLSTDELVFFDMKEGDYPKPIVQLPKAPKAAYDSLPKIRIERSAEWAERVWADFVEAGAEEVTRTS